MNRRKFIKGAAAGAMALGLPSPSRVGANEPTKQQPNVLFIAIDDLNDWVGCMGGHPDTLTPNIDRLAAKGLLFSNAHCTAPLCNASRASIVTGLRPSTTGVYRNFQPFRLAVPDAVTLPQHFIGNGYRVTGGGKIFHGNKVDTPSWQDYYPSTKNSHARNPVPEERPLNGIPGPAYDSRHRNFDWGPMDVDVDAMGDAKVANWAVAQLERQLDDPFFLGVGIFRPHLPWFVPRKYFDRFPADKVRLPLVNENDLDDIPPIGQEIARHGGHHAKVVAAGQWRNAVAGYLACVNFADEMVGRVLDALYASPHAKNTIVVLWSDHGWHLGEKLHWRKFALWEQATRNPLIISAPGLTTPGSRCSRSVSLLDLYPTLVDLCGLTPRPDLDGVSLRPLLANSDQPWDHPAITTYKYQNHSVRTDRWRYIRYRDGTEELYDHDIDANEWNNLAGAPEFAKVKARLAARLPTKNAERSPFKKRW